MALVKTGGGSVGGSVYDCTPSTLPTPPRPMHILVAERNGVQMYAVEKGAYTVKIGDQGKLFNEGRCAQDNWHEAYNTLHKLADKIKDVQSRVKVIK